NAGCAKYWYQEGKTFNEAKQDRKDCLEELKKYSPDWRDMGEYEFKFMNECMKSKGYRLVTENKLPLKVKRDDPDLMQNYRRKGIAGTLDEE
ncbi:MAG: hypothetical protein ACYS8Z_20605, partial [Planctomycetota bacterium]